MAKATIASQNTREQVPPKRSNLVPLLGFLMAAIYVSTLIYNYNFSSYDDGVAAEGARLILQGKIPYKDFWTMYSPGSAYLNALALLIFGESLVSLRIFGLLCGIVQAVMLYAVIRRVVRSSTAGIMCALVYISLIPLGVGAAWFTMVLGAVYSLIRYIESPSSKWCYLIGLFTALTFLFRQDSGAYLALAVMPLTWLATPQRGFQRLSPALKALGIFLVVAAAPIIYFASHGALAQLWECTARFPVVDFPASRPLPYPMPLNQVQLVGPYSAPLPVSFLYQLLGFYLLPVMLLAAGIVLLRSVIRNADRNNLIALSLLVVALALFMMVRVRPSGARIVASVTLGMLAYAVLAANKDRIIRLASAGILTLTLLSFAPFSAYSICASRDYAQSLIPGRGGLYAARGHAESLFLVSDYIKKHTTPGEKILSGSPSVYFLAGRDPATVYFEPHPCVTDTARVQQKIISDIESNRVRYFVRSREWDRGGYFTIEPNHQPDTLIQYIEDRYQPQVELGVFQIYKRTAPFISR